MEDISPTSFGIRSYSFSSGEEEAKSIVVSENEEEILFIPSEGAEDSDNSPSTTGINPTISVPTGKMSKVIVGGKEIEYDTTATAAVIKSVILFEKSKREKLSKEK
jgi:hypothetical protein